jgi:hypothetical protein
MLSTYVGRGALVIAVPLVAAALAGGTSACNDDTVRYGPANGLQGKTPNDQVFGADGGGTSGGTSSGTGEGGTGGCTPPAADAGADCPTFTTMWTKYFSPAGEWGCGKAGCHVAGGQAPGPMTDQAATYTLLKTTKVTSSTLNYINPSCIEASQSAITCNIAQKPTLCGLAVMPSGLPASAASLADLAKWVGCGSPGP